MLFSERENIFSIGKKALSAILCSSLFAKVPSSSDKSATAAASKLISLEAAIIYKLAVTSSSSGPSLGIEKQQVLSFQGEPYLCSQSLGTSSAPHLFGSILELHIY